jgi:hypothetical protein
VRKIKHQEYKTKKALTPLLTETRAYLTTQRKAVTIMTENKKLVKPNGGQQTSDENLDPLGRCIVSLINAMKLDFGHKFKSQFGDSDALRMYKRRLYAKLRDSNLEDIVNGYERFSDARNEWPPTIPEMVDFVEQARKARAQLESNRDEVERLAALPAPIIQCNPLEMLAKAKSAAQPAGKKDHDAWMERKAAALQNHNAVLTLHSHKIRKNYGRPEHQCNFPGCYKTGALSSATGGGGNFYCADHFRMQA